MFCAKPDGACAPFGHVEKLYLEVDLDYLEGISSMSIDTMIYIPVAFRNESSMIRNETSRNETDTNRFGYEKVFSLKLGLPADKRLMVQIDKISVVAHCNMDATTIETERRLSGRKKCGFKKLNNATIDFQIQGETCSARSNIIGQITGFQLLSLRLDNILAICPHEHSP